MNTYDLKNAMIRTYEYDDTDYGRDADGDLFEYPVTRMVVTILLPDGDCLMSRREFTKPDDAKALVLATTKAIFDGNCDLSGFIPAYPLGGK